MCNLHESVSFWNFCYSRCDVKSRRDFIQSLLVVWFNRTREELSIEDFFTITITQLQLLLLLILLIYIGVCAWVFFPICYCLCVLVVRFIFPYAQIICTWHLQCESLNFDKKWT